MVHAHLCCHRDTLLRKKSHGIVLLSLNGHPGSVWVVCVGGVMGQIYFSKAEKSG